MEAYGVQSELVGVVDSRFTIGRVLMFENTKQHISLFDFGRVLHGVLLVRLFTG